MRQKLTTSTRTSVGLVLALMLVSPAVVLGAPDPLDSNNGARVLRDRGTKKFSDDCKEDQECGFDGSYCDSKVKKCLCREEFQATNHIDKCGHAANINESCFFTEQCEVKTAQTDCRDGRCVCLFDKIPVWNKDGSVTCVAEIKEPPDMRYMDPAMIGILAGMALMFIILCVVLRLFSKARWRENRTIFNTPNARLMNVSLLKEKKLMHGHERRGSRASVRAPSRQPSMASLRAHSPNAAPGAKYSQHRLNHEKVLLSADKGKQRVGGVTPTNPSHENNSTPLSPTSRTGSRRGSHASSGNTSAKSNKSPPNHGGDVTVEILQDKP